MIVAMMAILLGASEPGPAERIAQLSVPSEVYWAAYRAAGAKLCNESLALTQARQFDKRYGSRVNILISRIQSDPVARASQEELVVTSDCHAFTNNYAARKYLRRVLNQFDVTLKAMERRYGISQR